MCSSMPAMLPPDPRIWQTQSDGQMFSYASTGSWVTSVFDPKEQSERELQRRLDQGLERTARAKETIMQCIRGPMKFLLIFWATSIVVLILITVWKNGGFKWLF